MGEPTQKRLIRKLDLERFLSKIRAQPSPKASLEQYTTSESVASVMMYLAAYTYSDIEGKDVLDLGCGTGRLGLAAALLGAKSVVGVDIDKSAVRLASENSVSLGFRGCTNWIAGDIDVVGCGFDTVVQNPPFGVQKRTADRRFLEKALDLGVAVYSLHNHPTFDKALMGRLKARGGQLVEIEPSPFLAHIVEAKGAIIEAVYALPLVIPHMFYFHKKETREIIIDLYVIKKLT
jgi:putative methylase